MHFGDAGGLEKLQKDQYAIQKINLDTVWVHTIYMSLPAPTQIIVIIILKYMTVTYDKICFNLNLCVVNASGIQLIFLKCNLNYEDALYSTVKASLCEILWITWLTSEMWLLYWSQKEEVRRRQKKLHHLHILSTIMVKL